MDYLELHQLFLEATNWISEHNLSVERSRLYRYLKELDKLSKWFKAGTLEEHLDPESGHYWRSLLYEALEITEIYKTLREHGSTDMARRLSEVSKGPLFLSEESPSSGSNSARNYQFELLAASRFQKAGFEVVLDDRNDFAISLWGRFLPIECKRLQSIEQVRKRIKEGCVQLKRSWKNLRPNSRLPGILIISIEKVSEQYKYIMISKSGEKAKAALGKKCTDFLLKHIDRVKEKGRKSVGGFIVTLNTMSEIGGLFQYGTFSTASYWADEAVGSELQMKLEGLTKNT